MSEEAQSKNIQYNGSQQTQSKFEGSSQDVQMIIKEAYVEKSGSFGSFFDSFATEYKLLKKITHDCQSKCYSNEKSTIKEAESCGRDCLKPYLTFKKITGEKLQKCEDQFKFAETKCISVNFDTNTCYQELNMKLRSCLKQNHSFYAKSYSNIFRDFDAIVDY